MKEIIHYLQKLVSEDITNITEHSHRGLIKDLLDVIINQNEFKNIKILHEPKRDKKGKGAPDFLIKRNGVVLGYIENKKLEAKLDDKDIERQIEKYKGLSNNLILTNYIEWRWIKNGVEEKHLRVSLSNDYFDIFKTTFKPKQEECEKLITLLQDFLKYNLEKEKIGTAEDLSTELAIRCHRLYEYSLLALKQEKEDKGIKQLYDLFKEKFFEDLKQDDFSKSFSQMITFTSLLAKLHTDSNSKNPNENVITIKNLKEHIPESFIVLHDLIKFFEGLENLQQDSEEDAYSLMHWVVNDEILAVINAIDTFSLNEQLSYCGGSKYKDNDEGLFSRDPYIYFYEEFLQKFDKKERQIRGAYYTPPPVVKYIISGINEMLKDNFDIHEGLADKNITLLDFAVGTGTFLVGVFKQIFDELQELNTPQVQIDNKIRNHILQNFFGFEYMISPFTISYLKLTRMIEDYGFKFTKQDCPKIYLTNTLEETKDPSNLFNLKGIEKHIRETMSVKTTKKILVITGNPPYLKSDKTTDHIKKNIQIAKYYPLSEEKNTQVLSNAYIKFIRFAHKRIEESGLEKGIVGIVTPTSYLEGITHRGMRNELLKTFSEIYILNLHGTRGIDDNVFGDRKTSHIGEPVCIAFFVKNKKKIEEVARVFYKSTLNWKRIDKYRFLWDNSIKTSGFERLDIEGFNKEFEKTQWAKNRFKIGKTNKVEPLSLFAPFSDGTVKKIKTYGAFWGLGEVFLEKNSGCQLERDETQEGEFAVTFDKKKMQSILADFKKLSFEEVRNKYKIKDNRDWQLERVYQDISKRNNIENYIQKIAYRPFDIRYTDYTQDKTKALGTYLRQDCMQHMLKPNLALFFKRGWVGNWVGNTLVDCNILAGRTYLAPLYLYKTEEKKHKQEDWTATQEHFDADGKKLNLTPEFLAFFEKQYGTKLATTPAEKFYKQTGEITAEMLLGYIYAILNRTDYRQEWEEFLDIDFPRIPFVESMEEFLKLAKAGFRLVKIHLMEDKTIYEIRKKWKDYGVLTGTDFKVQSPKYEEATQRFMINENSWLANVPKSVIDLQIGAISNVDGVLGQYLKARRDRALDEDEQLHIQNIVKVLLESEEVLKEINSIKI